MKSDYILIAALIVLIIIIIYKTKNASEYMHSRKTLVFFYADWCGYCKKFWPTWNKLKGQKNINFVEISDKQAALYNVRSFPTIRLYSGDVSPNDHTYKEYRGDRSLGDLLSFTSSP